MQRINDGFNRKHLRSIRNKVQSELGISLRKNTRSFAQRAGIAFAVFAVCLMTITPALAAEIPVVNDLLYRVLPETAQFFKPVQNSAVDKGIEIRVESAYVHGAKAEVLVSVRDLKEDRLDATVDFYDSYDIRTGFDSVGTCNQIGYDEATKTATFLIQTSSMNPNDTIRGKKITISFQTLLSGKLEELDVPVQMDWSAISDSVKTEQSDQNGATVLMPGEKMFNILEGFTITGVGYIDGKLHIQLYTPGRNQFDDHAALYLKNENGTLILGNPIYRSGYNTGDPDMDRRADYIDYVFDISQDRLAKYTLYGDFYSAKTRVDGNWSITFPLEND